MPSSFSEFFADRGGQLLIASIFIALAPLLHHFVSSQMQNLKRKRSRFFKKSGNLPGNNKQSPRSSFSKPPRASSSRHFNKTFANAEKVPPRPRVIPEEILTTPPLSENDPSIRDTISNSDQLFDTAHASLELLRQTPNHLKEPVIDQLAKIIEALQIEFKRRY